MNSSPQPYDQPAGNREALPHWVFLSGAVIVILLSFTMRTGANVDKGSGAVERRQAVYLPWSNTPLPPICGARRYLGISCPGCGLTRSLIAISHGEFGRAWSMNAASFLIYGFLLTQIPWHLFQLVRIRQKRPTIKSLWLFLPIAVCVIALTVQWIVRMSLGIRVV